MYYNPAAVGITLDDVDTPALIIDLDAFEHNLRGIDANLPLSVKLRPHSKSHKCPTIALQQVNRNYIFVVYCLIVCCLN